MTTPNRRTGRVINSDKGRPPFYARYVKQVEQEADDAGHPDDAAAALKGKGETIHADRRVARNAPCPCGSGKKSKRCCGG